jgi:Transmembrane amino acid transporter protein
MESNQEPPTTLEIASAENGVAATTSGGTNSPSTGDAPLRQGTISSARFNILCTMVGGGCLSLPMAFQKTGNGFFGPMLLVITAFITEFCFRLIVAAIRRLSPVRETTTVIGKDSFETMASAAFGAQGFLFAKWLVTAVSNGSCLEFWLGNLERIFKQQEVWTI